MTEYKSFKASMTGEGTFTGYAAVYGNVDYQNDIIKAGAFASSLKSRASWPLIWNHDDSRPGNVIGRVSKAREDAHGLLVEARLDLDNPTALDAFKALKAGSVGQLSVGMVAEAAAHDAQGHRVISKASLLEVSVTPTAANPEANIITVKTATQPTERNTMADETTTQPTGDADAQDAPKTAKVNVSGTVTVTAADDAQTTKDAERETKPAPIDTKSANEIKKVTDMLDAPKAATGRRYLDLKSMAASIPAAVRKSSAQRGITKGIAAEGSSLIAVPLVNTTPIAGDTASEATPRLIDHLPVVTRTAPVYDALIQTAVAEPGGAAVVAEGEQKPTTKLQIKRVEQRLRVIATLSDPIDKYALLDAANLDTWVGAQLTNSVRNALESEVVNGDGTGEHMTGLANVAGVQTQAFDTTPLDTLAAALNKLEVINVTATMVAMPPPTGSRSSASRTTTATTT